MALPLQPLVWKLNKYLCFICQNDSSIWLSDGRVELAKDDGLLGYGDVLLGAVVNVVHPDTDQLLRVVDGGLQGEVSWGEDVLAA